MRSLRSLGLLTVFVAACAAPAVPAPSSSTPSAGVAATPTLSPSATATQTTTQRATFAAVCGTINNFVSDNVQTDGSFVLNSPGRDPLKITIPAGRLGGVVADYVCVGVRAGVPYPLLDGFFTPGSAGYVNSGTLPATTVLPAPSGFVLPQACAYVAPPVVSADQTDWKIDCGAANKDARGALGPAFGQQGWLSCGSGLASAQWRKNDVLLAVAESSLAPGDYPRLTQVARVSSPCS